ncbi:MAG: hypothetical protein ACJ8CB_33710 [Ktedonobacteraceae bacterium]
MCAAPSCGTLLMCRLDQERAPEPLRPLSAHVDAACSTDQVGDPGSHIPLSGDVRPAVHDGPPHTTRPLTSDVTERFPLLDTLEHGSPLRGRDLPARIRYSLKVAGQRHEQRIVKGTGERIFSG